MQSLGTSVSLRLQPNVKQCALKMKLLSRHSSVRAGGVGSIPPPSHLSGQHLLCADEGANRQRCVATCQANAISLQGSRSRRKQKEVQTATEVILTMCAIRNQLQEKMSLQCTTQSLGTKGEPDHRLWSVDLAPTPSHCLSALLHTTHLQACCRLKAYVSLQFDSMRLRNFAS